MVTATKKSRAAGQRARRVPIPEWMQFLMSEDNGAAHNWRLVAGLPGLADRFDQRSDDSGAAWARAAAARP
jgi:hypothetical protein